MWQYPEVYNRLNIETAIVVFIKRDGSIRTMLCTRNLRTTEIEYGFTCGNSLRYHENRCNIHNGNIAVIDLVIGEARAFNIDRVINIEFLGEISTKDDLEKAMERYLLVKQAYDEKVREISLDDLD